MLGDFIHGLVGGLAVATLGLALAGWSPGQLSRNPAVAIYGAVAGVAVAMTAGAEGRTRQIDRAISVYAEVVG